MSNTLTLFSIEPESNCEGVTLVFTNGKFHCWYDEEDQFVHGGGQYSLAGALEAVGVNLESFSQDGNGEVSKLFDVYEDVKSDNVGDFEALLLRAQEDARLREKLKPYWANMLK